MPSGAEAKADAFYAGLLGLARVPKPEALAGRGGAWFRGEGVEVHLGVEADFRPARKAHPAFLVTELQQLRARLEDGGVEIEEQPPLEGFRRLHAFDPFGNRLEFLEPLE
jgi:catechol 2,3-dioxygenase-like lactoylglutathione lyase family enzyme